MGKLQAVIITAIQTYQRLVAPAFPPACRFFPSCSSYALGAVKRHGPGRGLWLTARRVLRCHPYHPGGLDPVP